MKSHLQTRTLTDALNLAAAVLESRNTSLAHSEQRDRLSLYFAKESYPRFFESWAYLASDFDDLVQEVEQKAPQLVKRLKKPTHPNDFTVLGNCSFDLRFSPDPNAADPIDLKIQNGKQVAGAVFTSSCTRQYSNQLIEVPTENSESVFFYSPNDEPGISAAKLAQQVLANKGDVVRIGLTLKFPVARTSNLLGNTWVTKLVSTCGLYRIWNYLSAGNALVDHNGFFAQETQIVQLKYLSIFEEQPEVIIDRPFLVFFADSHGIHAAAWFSWDSFREAVD